MKKIHVDEILASVEKSPAPSAYTLPSSFGTGRRYSMRPKLDLFKVHLQKQSKLPGPGEHIKGHLHLSGKVQVSSQLNNQPRNAFPTSADRFYRTKVMTPEPGAYQPRFNFNENVKSNFKNSGKTAFSKNELNFTHSLWTKDECPAPNAYNAFSEFSGL